MNMVTAQIQLSDQLFSEASKRAADQGLDLPELLREGLVKLLENPAHLPAATAGWELPMAFDLGVPLIEEAKWTAVSHD